MVFIGLTRFFTLLSCIRLDLWSFFLSNLIFLSASLEIFTLFLFTWWLSEKLLYVHLIYQFEVNWYLSFPSDSIRTLTFYQLPDLLLLPILTLLFNLSICFNTIVLYGQYIDTPVFSMSHAHFFFIFSLSIWGCFLAWSISCEFPSRLRPAHGEFSVTPGLKCLYFIFLSKDIFLS